MNEFTQELDEINEWLSNRPSATMDPSFEEVLVKRARLRELKSLLRTTQRPLSGMMAAQQMEK